jgi:hypothetical protein
MMDGLSATKLNSLSDEDTAMYNIFDEYINNSRVISKLYGSGETFASVASKLTGESIRKLGSDDWLQKQSFNSKNNIANYLKEKYNTRNIFYRNYSDKYPTVGAYKRFNDLCTNGFDKYILADNSRITLSESKVVKQYEDYFELTNTNQNKFIFIHDLFLHDHPTAYENTTYDGYKNGIIESSKHFQNNLCYLQFDKKKDILIISSDHGLTINPYKQMFSNEDIPINQYNIYKKELYSENKLRAFLSIYSSNIKKQIISQPLIMKDANYLVKKTIEEIVTNDFNYDETRDSCSITSVADLTFGNTTPKALREKFHTHIICYDKNKKFVYTKWPKIEIYKFELKGYVVSKKIKYEELPIEMQNYIKSYYSYSNFLKKSIWIIKVIYRFMKEKI